MKKLISHFFQGLLFTVPIAATIWVLFKLFGFVDGIIGDFLPSPMPGVGLLVILILITFAGYLGTTFVSAPILNLLERTIEKTPLIKLIYSSVKDLISAFVGEKKRFTQPVLVTINKETGLQQIGFITQNDLSEIGLGKEKIAVYLPFSYSFMGGLFIVPRENVSPIDSSGTEMMKFIISGGVTEI